MRKQAEERTVSKSNEVKGSRACSAPSGLQHHPLRQGFSCTVGCIKLVFLGCSSTKNVAWISQYRCTFLLLLVKHVLNNSMESSSEGRAGSLIRTVSGLCDKKKVYIWTSISWSPIKHGLMITAAVSKNGDRLYIQGWRNTYKIYLSESKTTKSEQDAKIPQQREKYFTWNG